VFGTREARAIDERVSGFCEVQLGSRAAEVLFRVTSVGVVLGLRRADGRRVVLKAHQPRESRARLDAFRSVQSSLFQARLPYPGWLVGPASLGDVSELLAGVDGRVDDVVGRRERALPLRVVAAGGVIEEVEVDGEASAVAAEVGALRGVNQIAPAAVAGRCRRSGRGSG
jgi:hypothetical protein